MQMKSSPCAFCGNGYIVESELEKVLRPDFKCAECGFSLSAGEANAQDHGAAQEIQL